MKKVSLLLTFIIITFYSFSQDRSGFVGIGLGSGIPVGAFAASSGSYNNAGYATNGFSFNINFNYKLNDWFGLSISDIGAANGMSADKLVSSVYPGNSGISSTVNKPSSVGCFLIGGYVKKHDFPLYGKVLIGYGNVRTADITLSDNTGKATIQQSEATYGFAYSVGAGALFPLSDRWALTISLDFVSCLATPSVIAVDNTTGARSVSPTFGYGQSFINSQIGIGYMFK